eukprot:scaffold14602_cov118-Isochrysis_galbana.AAC.15
MLLRLAWRGWGVIESGRIVHQASERHIQDMPAMFRRAGGGWAAARLSEARHTLLCRGMSFMSRERSAMVTSERG